MLKTKELILNMGPQHPSTHGVLRLVLQLEGETVVGTDVVIGYLHRGSEKVAETLPYFEFIPYTDRLDYTAALANNLGYVLAVEKISNIHPPERAEFIRVLLTEFQRIAAHLVWLGTHAMDIGAMSVFLYCFREREAILDLFEMVTGARLTVNFFRIGGVPADLPPQFFARAWEFIETFPDRIRDYEALLTRNKIWLKRTKNVAVITPEDAIDLGLTGPSLRGSGVSFDIRRAEPYSIYERLQFDIPIGSTGDVYDRYMVRVEEMRQCCRIIRQCLEQIPEGDLTSRVPRKLKPPPGEVYVRTEAPKGELGFYIASDGGEKPYRMKIRAPSFVNLQSLPHMARGGLVADIVAAIGSIDVVLGEVDR